MSERRLRFTFDAETPGQAIDLARELRTRCNGNRVLHLGPSSVPPHGRRRWSVAVETPPTALDSSAIHRVHEEMAQLAREGHGRRYLGWKPLTGSHAGE